MSSIGSINTSSTERLQVLLMQQAVTASSTGSSAATTQSSASSSTDISETNPKGMAALQKLIEQAIEAALASLDKTSSAQEVMATIKKAIDSTLQANGVTPPSSQGASGAAAMGPPPTNGPPPPDGGSLGQTIDKLLQQAGFDPEKIKSQLAQGQSSTASSSSGSAASLTLLIQIPLSNGIDTQV
jgi:hypothetical protein